VARTLDPEAHAIKREAFLDAAQRLIQVKGYESTSVQDVLDSVQTSKGAFYHYFDSKGALLNGVIERMVDAALTAVSPIIEDPDLPAPVKLRGVFGGIAAWKTARKELLLAITKNWMSDDNAIVREKFRRLAGRRLTPLIARIIRQGKDEGTFTASEPDDAARVFVSTLLALSQAATELYIARQAGEIAFDDVRRELGAYAEGLERILGAPAGSMPLVDESVLHEWFG
jgi:AcrR family transcriptional regulator